MKNKKILRPLTTKEKAILIPSLLPGFIEKGAIKTTLEFQTLGNSCFNFTAKRALGYYYSQNDWQEVID